MATKPSNNRNNKGYWAAVLLLAGLCALLLSLAPAASTSAHLLGSLKNGFAGPISTLGVSLVHAVGAVAFGQVDYAALFARILVLFSGMVAIVLSLVRLLSRSSNNGATHSPSPSSAPHGQESL